ncbi:MAG: CPBP family intramembrane glutamic endopeptidase [Cyanobacteriota bacterium]|nr:CPBP family intramembrane glutamic endopeptidase [Cyanobacteriota bacterium]
MKINLHRIATYPAPFRLGIFILGLLLLWLPLAVPLFWLLRDNPNLSTIVTMGALAIEFLIFIPVWGKWVYRESQLFARYGLSWERGNAIALLNGLAIGLIFVLGLFVIMGSLGWLEFQPNSRLWRVVAEGLLSASAIALGEEIFFRGWLLDELERDYSPKIALWVNASLFAILHFLKPIAEAIRTFPQFPGLIILGLALVWAKRSHRNRLGISIGLHGGLVWGYYILNVGQLVKYNNVVSPWITGVDGNPVGGAMGILGLSLLAVWMGRRDRSG